MGEVQIETRNGPAIRIVDPDFVVLRAVSRDPGVGTYSFNPSERILDLRHLDPRTAKLEEPRPNLYVISIRTTDEGDRRLGAWTSANLQKQLGIFVDNRLVSAPIIQSRITDMIVLDGDFTKSEAEEILARLRRGGA